MEYSYLAIAAFVYAYAQGIAQQAGASTYQSLWDAVENLLSRMRRSGSERRGTNGLRTSSGIG